MGLQGKQNECKCIDQWSLKLNLHATIIHSNKEYSDVNLFRIFATFSKHNIIFAFTEKLLESDESVMKEKM